MLLRHLVASGGGVTLLSPFWPPVFLLSIHWKEASGRCLRMRVNSLLLLCQRLPGVPDCQTGPHSKNPLKLPAFFFPTVLWPLLSSTFCQRYSGSSVSVSPHGCLICWNFVHLVVFYPQLSLGQEKLPSLLSLFKQAWVLPSLWMPKTPPLVQAS